MKYDIITLFPEMFEGPLSVSMIKRAADKGLIEINYHHLRDYASDKHKIVDDSPCGGGKGLVLKVDIMDKAISAVKKMKNKIKKEKQRVILMTPKGQRFNQDKAIELARDYDRIILVCGHYEGFDERIREHLADEEISLGDFVLTGGEIPAMAIVDATARLIPGVLSEGSAESETFMQKDESGEYLKEYPQYTRPVDYKGWKVPEVLLSGNHAEIEKWRREHQKYN